MPSQHRWSSTNLVCEKVAPVTSSTEMISSQIFLALCSLAYYQLVFARDPITTRLTGHIDPEQVFTFVYVPFEVPPGTTSIYVIQNYTDKGAGNALDLGVFDERGYELAGAVNGTTGWRGWSGGFRSNFTIGSGGATPGYNAGPISPGTWNVVLGPYTSNPGGIDWTLDITFGFAEVTTHYSTAYSATNMDQFPLVFDQAEDETWLRGDFHLHSVHSDGRYTPDEQIRNAVSQDLDFIFFTEHNTDSGNQIYGAYSPIAPDLLICRGIEVTTRHGHWQALGLDREQKIEWRYHPGDDPGYEAATQQVRRAGALVSINHPFQTCSRCDWAFDWDHNEAIEVWNGKWDATDQLAVDRWQQELVASKRIAAIGGSDAHSSPDLVGLPTTVVRSRGKSQTAIVEAVKRGYAYLVREKEMSIDMVLDVDGKMVQTGQVANIQGGRSDTVCL